MDWRDDMEIEVIERKENKLLEREEIKFIIKYDGATPTRKEVKEAIKNELGIGGYIVIKHIKPLFGIKEAKVYAKVYPSEAIARKIEPDYIFAREGKKKEEEK